MPQFHTITCRFEKQNMAVGVTLLFFGLFKKVVLADHIAPFVTPIYQHVVAGDRISFFLAWMAAIGFTLQMYFDFSGYTDMALGLARCFGIRLPPNFDSPLRASNIIDFWLRWHMTLTRFLTAYVYNPMVLSLTRRRLAAGKPGFSGRNTTGGAFVSLLMVPTVITMFVSGLWHGAGYGFIVWGLLHGLYISINHGWRVVAIRWWPDKRRYERVMKPTGLVLTFIVVTATMVFFRAPTIASAVVLVAGMIGLNGISLPVGSIGHLRPLAGVFHSIGVLAEPWTGQEFLKTAMWISVLLFVALACPNTLQILGRFEPALWMRPPSRGLAIAGIEIRSWDPSFLWAFALSAIAATAIVSIAGPSEFLYWNF